MVASRRGRADPLAWTGSHPLLRDRAGHDLGYRPDVFDDLHTAPVANSLTLLTGPRRVGKSVAMLDLAANLCRRGDVNPARWCTCRATACGTGARPDGACVLGSLGQPTISPQAVTKPALLRRCTRPVAWTAPARRSARLRAVRLRPGRPPTQPRRTGQRRRSA
jgi:hypothetical protein